MQTIFKTAAASNFTIYANDLINSDMPPIPFRILSYLLSKPVTWQLKTHDLRKQLGLSNYAIKKALRWLCSAGFAVYTRLKTGHTIWRIFDKPQTKTAHSPEIPPQVEIPQVAFQPDLVITETELKKETTTPTAPPIPESIVVVDSEELIYPVQLTPVQKKAAKHVIKKVEQPELQQDVLFALAYAITSGTVKSPVAYLNGLITRANNGTFEAVQTADASNRSKPIIPIWTGHKAPPKVDNDSFFQDLRNRFGSKVDQAIPAGVKA
jgi:hypothetical protein